MTTVTITEPRIVNAPDLDNVRLLDQAIVPLVCDMQRRGVRVDVGRLRSLEAQLIARQVELEADLYRLCGKEFNPGSPDQVAAILYGELGVDSSGVKWLDKRGRFSVQKKFMEAKAAEHEAIPLLLDWAECATLLSDFVGKLPTLVRRDGRIHSDIQICRVPSGRLAFKNPNLMAIPKRSKLGKQIRTAFVPSPGLVFVAADFSQLEMRVQAHESEDANMLAVFWDGADIHRRTAAKAASIAESAVTPEQRDSFKSTGFGIIYEISAPGLCVQLAARRARKPDGSPWSEEDCQALLIDPWYAEYPGVRSYQIQRHERMRRYGKAWDMWGRERLLPEAYSTINRVVAEGERKAVNHPIQSGATGIMKVAMARLDVMYREYRGYGCEVWPLIQLHDDMLVECEPWLVPELTMRTKEIMESAADLLVPLRADPSTGENWGDMQAAA